MNRKQNSETKSVVVQSLITGYTVVEPSDDKLVLLLHGWGDSGSTFDKIINGLPKMYGFVCLDLPGFGRTESPKETFTLERYAQFIRDFLEKIGADDLYAIIGHSNGGAIAIRGVADGLLKPKKLILLASSGVRSTYNGRKKILRLTAKAAKIPIKVLPLLVQQKLKKKAYQTIGSDLFVAEDLQETFKQIVSEDLVERAARVKVPTLLVYGTEDMATPLSYGELFHSRILHSQLQVVTGAGHFLHHTHSDDVVEKINHFLGLK